MDLLYQAKYLTKKLMLTVMGPAELDEHVDPVKKLDREKKERSGDTGDDKPAKEYPKKRKFDSGESTPTAKKSAPKKAPAKKAAAKPQTTADAKPAKKAPAQKATSKKTTTKPRNQPG